MKIRLHCNWKKLLLGQEIGNLGFHAIEIDESAIIGNNHRIYWILGLIDRITKEARIFCVLENRTRDNLLPFVKENVNTNDNVEEEISEAESNKARIYSDCFQSYQVSDFARMNYILKRINHSL